MLLCERCLGACEIVACLSYTEILTLNMRSEAAVFVLGYFLERCSSKGSDLDATGGVARDLEIAVIHEQEGLGHYLAPLRAYKVYFRYLGLFFKVQLALEEVPVGIEAYLRTLSL